MRILPVFSILLLSTFAFSQEKEDEYVSSNPITYEDRVYKNYIASVKFHIIGAELTLPIIDITDGRLVLSFDDLEADVKDFYYTIVHCDKNWNPSEDLNEMDYIDGFSEEELDNYAYSSNTLQPFTSYQLALPNEDMRWTLSGNYILKVYTDEGEDDLVLTRRFIVVDSKVKISADVTRAFDIKQIDSHQEVDFAINHKGFPIVNPMQEVSVSIMQNGMWPGMISNIKPLFIKNERLEYDYQGKIVFSGLKEYRNLDLRSFRYRTDRVAEIYETRDGTDILLKSDEFRIETPYIYEMDMNGNFFIENIYERQEDIRADYALTTFSLSTETPYENGHVYILGKMTDWQLMDKFRMAYDDKSRTYKTSVFLKNGYYNYLYAYVPFGKETVDFSTIEGSTYETDNDYTIIVYYKPFGGRYDQVIAAYTLNSIDN